MAKINSKNKGSNFELQVAKLLSSWSGYEFHRVPMSGALHWNNDKRVLSDIVPPQELLDKGWKFSIECKKVETSWELSTLLEGTSQTIKEHWKQCVEDANREEMTPMLIFSKNYRGEYIVMNSSDYEKVYKDVDHDVPRLELTRENQRLSIVNLREFLKFTSVENFLGV